MFQLEPGKFWNQFEAELFRKQRHTLVQKYGHSTVQYFLKSLWGHYFRRHSYGLYLHNLLIFSGIYSSFYQSSFLCHWLAHSSKVQYFHPHDQQLEWCYSSLKAAAVFLLIHLWWVCSTGSVFTSSIHHICFWNCAGSSRCCFVDFRHFWCGCRWGFLMTPPRRPCLCINSAQWNGTPPLLCQLSFFAGPCSHSGVWLCLQTQQTCRKNFLGHPDQVLTSTIPLNVTIMTFQTVVSGSALVSFYNLSCFVAWTCFIFRSSLTCIKEYSVVECYHKVWRVREYMSSGSTISWKFLMIILDLPS